MKKDPRIYIQVENGIRKQITDGTLVTGQKIPSIGELQAKYGGARYTVAKALHKLADDGTLERVPGFGYYVASGKGTNSMFSFSAFEYKIIVPDTTVSMIIELFMRARKEAPNGSSFAVTSDAPQGFRSIYMTKTSCDTLMSTTFKDEVAPVWSTRGKSYG